MKAEFDRFAGDYDALLRDPIRDRFGGDSGFFHFRKWVLLEDWLRRRGARLKGLRWLDVGCGRGELLRIGAGEFLEAAGCDPSEEMLRACEGLAVKHQAESASLPFGDAAFDVVTAACVYHHLAPAERIGLAKEAGRVLREGGVFVVFEHNPWNPITRVIVSRTPVDADARLLSPYELRGILRTAGMNPVQTCYYLYFPRSVYRALGALERSLASLPLGGQYAVIATQQEGPSSANY